MTINDFLNVYYLHDSLIEKVVYDNNNVDLTIDFCFWMQKSYCEEDPETGIIHLHFPDVTNLTGPIGDIDDYSILEAKYHEGCLSLLLMDDINNACHEMKITTSSGDVEVCV